jgi:hypothetical protein
LESTMLEVVDIVQRSWEPNAVWFTCGKG